MLNEMTAAELGEKRLKENPKLDWVTNVDKSIPIHLIIGNGCKFEPPFSIETYPSLAILDKNKNVFLHFGSWKWSIGFIDQQYDNYCIVVKHICDLLNKQHCKEKECITKEELKELIELTDTLEQRLRDIQESYKDIEFCDVTNYELYSITYALREITSKMKYILKVHKI